MTTEYRVNNNLTDEDIEALDGKTVKVEVNPGKAVSLVPVQHTEKDVRLLVKTQRRVRAKDNGQPEQTARPATETVSSPAHREEP